MSFSTDMKSMAKHLRHKRNIATLKDVAKVMQSHPRLVGFTPLLTTRASQKWPTLTAMLQQNRCNKCNICNNPRITDLQPCTMYRLCVLLAHSGTKLANKRELRYNSPEDRLL
jgi:hypothetical protein